MNFFFAFFFFFSHTEHRKSLNKPERSSLCLSRKILKVRSPLKLKKSDLLGRSLGTAEVVFAKRSVAAQTVKDFDAV